MIRPATPQIPTARAVPPDPRPGADPGVVAWCRSAALVGFEAAVAAMEARAEAIAQGAAGECLWLLEHPALYTAGTSAQAQDLVAPDRFPVYRAGRGGQYTYHGPGQRIVYVMLDVKARTGDLRAFVSLLEGVIVDTLSTFAIHGETRRDRVGVWVRRPDKGAGREDKIAAIGIRVRRWVSFHGLALNVAPDLEHFSGIVPCGIREHGVTSFADLGVGVTMAEVDQALVSAFAARLGVPIVGPGDSLA